MADEAAFPPSDFNKLSVSSAAMDEWFSNDIAGFLNPEIIMEFQNVPSTQDSVYYPTSSPEQQLCVSDSAYSSDSSDTPNSSPFDQYSTDSIHSGISSPIDEALFEPFQLADPLVVPEIEKILASNPYEMDLSPPASPEEPPTQSKKRKMENDSKTTVTLSRDQLLTMTSKEIEDYVADLKTKRALTAAEEKDLKRQRRLVKNREYASQSRSRKKQFVDELEKQLEAARAETEEVKKQNKTLLEENKLLKRQLGCIAETIKKSQLNAGKEAAASGGSSLSASSGSVSTSLVDKFKIGAGRSSAAASKGVSACLLAIFFMVFTFAAFWDNESNFSKSEQISFRQREILEFAQDDAGVWDAASALLRQSWEASAEYLPSWDSAYSLFISSYPIFFAPRTSSSPSSTPLPTKAIENVLPCTEHSHPSLPSSLLANETKRCSTRGSAS